MTLTFLCGILKKNVFQNCQLSTVTLVTQKKSFLETVILLYCNAWELKLALSKKTGPLPHKFEWIEMNIAIAKKREEYGLMKTDLSKQKIGGKKF